MMVDESGLADMRQVLQLNLDHAYESRHELVTKLAYEHWEQRGRPVGSPDVDWFAAERAVYESLVESGLITLDPDHARNMKEDIYRPNAH